MYHSLRDSLFIISQLSDFVKNFFELFIFIILEAKSP